MVPLEESVVGVIGFSVGDTVRGEHNKPVSISEMDH
jgi:hypothetical protein